MLTMVGPNTPPHKSAKYLSSGYWQIPTKVASRLCEGKLPRHGYEKLIVYQGKRYWISRTVNDSKSVWSMKLDRGQTVYENARGVQFTM